MREPAAVLVIDDDPGIRDMLSLALAETGHTVTAWDGAGAPPSNEADVVLLDIRLGNRSASELLAEVPWLSTTPTVVMTASIGGDAATRDIPHAAVVVSKPFDLAVVEDAIRLATAAGTGGPQRASKSRE